MNLNLPITFILSPILTIKGKKKPIPQIISERGIGMVIYRLIFYF